jgi:hypothetical protein
MVDGDRRHAHAIRVMHHTVGHIDADERRVVALEVLRRADADIDIERKCLAEMPGHDARADGTAHFERLIGGRRPSHLPQ